MTDTPTAARHTGTLRFTAAMDNHVPTRDYSIGMLEEWAWPDDGRITYRIPEGVTLFLRNTPHAVFLADDGATVRPLYVTGWAGRDDVLFLAAFPVNAHADGSPVMRTDNPTRPVDYSTWMTGPSRCYHLKTTRITTKD